MSLLFSPLQVVYDRTIFIPAYVRAALGLHRHIKVYLSTIQPDKDSIANEIIVSPVPIKARDALWRLRATFMDRAGILAELCQLLRAERIEIVSARAYTLEQNQILNVELLLNTEYYRTEYLTDSSPRESAAGPTLPELRARIIAKFIQDLDLPFGVKPILSIRRNIPLYRSKLFIGDLKKSYLTEDRIVIPEIIIDTITTSFLHTYPSVRQLKGKARLPLASLVGDAENSVIRILMIYKNTGHIHVRARIAGKFDCLPEITGELRRHSFNILQLYDRILRDKNREEVWIDFLLHLPVAIDKDKNDAKLRKYVWGVFKSKSLKGLDCVLEFPRLLESALPENK